MSKQHSKQAIRHRKLRKITKSLLTQFSQLQEDISIDLVSEVQLYCLQSKIK